MAPPPLRIPVSDGPAVHLAPPPLRLLQPWVPASLRVASLDPVGAEACPPAPSWRQRLLGLLRPSRDSSR